MHSRISETAFGMPRQYSCTTFKCKTSSEEKAEKYKLSMSEIQKKKKNK